MSRSVFAARFSESLDRPPMEFPKEVRLGRAAELLARTDLPVKAIASRVGYSSRSADRRKGERRRSDVSRATARLPPH